MPLVCTGSAEEKVQSLLVHVFVLKEPNVSHTMVKKKL